jgi:hypothetical protein
MAQSNWRTGITGQQPFSRERRAGSKALRAGRRPGKPVTVKPADLTMLLLSRSIAADLVDLIDSIRRVD